MIHANELRIGNLVDMHSYVNGAKVLLRSKVDGAYINWIERGESQCEPIPITSDILQRCGFIKSLHEDNTHLFTVSYGVYFRIDLGKNIEESLDANTYYHCNTLVKLEYLHKLQNLYFALTEKELNVQICV